MSRFIKKNCKINKINKLVISLMDFCFNLGFNYYYSLFRSPYKVYKLVFLLSAPVILTHEQAMSMAYQLLLNEPNPKTADECLQWIMGYIMSGKFLELYYFLLQFSDLLDTMTPEQTRVIEEFIDIITSRDDDAFDALINSNLYTGNFHEFRQKIADFAEELHFGPKFGVKPPSR